MNIQEEKQFIYEMMKDITKERRKLTEIYFSLKERLDFLNLQEQKGLEDLSLKGYVDLFNETQKELAITNIKREANHIVEKISNNNIEEIETPILKEKKEKEKIRIRARRSKISMEKVSNAFIHILKEEGIPVKLKDLFDKTEKYLDMKLSKSYLQNSLKVAMENSSRIEKPIRGYYQYKL